MYNKAAGIEVFHVLSDGPDSINNTFISGSAESLFARTQPALPAPIII